MFTAYNEMAPNGDLNNPVQTAVLQLGTTSVLLSWLAFFNFNTSSFKTSDDGSCIAPLTPYQQVALSLAMPWVFTVELGIIAVIHRIAFACHRCYSAGKPAAAAAAPSTTVVPSAASTQGNEVMVQPALAGFAWRAYVAALMEVLLFAYTGVASTVFKYLWCVDVLGVRVVFASPQMNCGSEQWRVMLAPVLFMLIAFVAGFPLFIVGLGWKLAKERSRRAQANAKLPPPMLQLTGQGGGELAVSAEPSSSSLSPDSSLISANTWAPLFGMYLPRRWYWMPVVLVRRCVFVVLDVTLAQLSVYRSLSFVV